MTYTALFIDKGGIKKDIPGFSEKFSSSEFGFWGEYSLLDFALYNIDSDKCFFICEKEMRKSINNVLMKWDEKKYEFFPYNSDYDNFSEFIDRIDDEVIVFYDLSFGAVLQKNEFRKITENFKNNKKAEILKVSINEIPVDIYIADKSTVENQIDSMKNRIMKETNIFDFIMNEILANSFDEIINLNGDVLFNKSISQIFKNNISLLDIEKSDIMESFMNNTPDPVEKDSVITSKGNVVNSIISSNTRIEGFVENSVIFSGVTVKQNCVIKNSVIMNGNQIGKNVCIENSIVLPNLKQSGSNSNIQDRCIIGGKSKAKNSKYPEQITEGMTVIGMNSSVPPKFTAEPGSLIGADISLSLLKEIKKIKKSGSVL